MLNGYRIIDADCHILEPLDLWRERLPPDLVHRRPRLKELEPKMSLLESVERFGWRGVLPDSTRLVVDGEEVWHAMSGALTAESVRVTTEHFGAELDLGTTLCSAATHQPSFSTWVFTDTAATFCCSCQNYHPAH